VWYKGFSLEDPMPTLRTRLLVLGAALLLAAPPAFAGRDRRDPPGDFGAYGVGHSVVELVDESRAGRRLTTEIWYPAIPDETSVPTFYDFDFFGLGLPAEHAFEDAPAGPLAFSPLIVFSHGSGGASWQSTFLMEALASHGFVVAAPNHTGNTVHDSLNGTSVPLLESANDRPRDVSFVIDQMLARSADPLDPLFARVNPVRIGVAGHSFGGYTAIAMAAGMPALGIEPDPRVLAIAPIAPASSFFPDETLAGIDVPMFLLSGSLDTTTPIDPNTTRPWQLVDGPPVYRADVQGATHTHFAAVCDIGAVLSGLGFSDEAIDSLVPDFLITCRPPALDPEEVKRIQVTYLVAFFRRTLDAYWFYDQWLTEEWSAEHEPLVHYDTKGTEGGDPN
jgi:predicted dienelactone hydrolase